METTVSHYAGRLEDQTLLVCNDLDLFQSVLTGRSTDGQAPLVSLLNQRREQSDAPIVGVRDFRMAGRADPTNPLNEASVLDMVDTQAETFVFEAGGASDPLRMSWYTQSDTDVWEPIADDRDFMSRPRVERIEGGWRLTVDEPIDLFFGYFVGSAMLGFAIYV